MVPPAAYESKITMRFDLLLQVIYDSNLFCKILFPSTNEGPQVPPHSLPHPPLKFFLESPGGISHVLTWDVQSVITRHPLPFPPLHSGPPGLGSLGSLLAPLSVLLSSAAPARPTLSMEHLLIPTRQCCSHEIPSQLLWLPLPPSTTLVFSNLGSVRSKATEGPNILWSLTEVAMRDSFHFHTWFPLSEDSNMGN